jgi:ubiquinone biosynthesis protein
VLASCHAGRALLSATHACATAAGAFRACETTPKTPESALLDVGSRAAGRARLAQCVMEHVVERTSSKNLLRGLLVGLVILAYLAMYSLRRLGTLLISEQRARRAEVARLQGVMLRRAMSRLGACFVKLGQVMSSRPDLFEPELIEELRKLQDKLPPFAFAEVRRTLEASLGKRVEELFSEFDEQPVAAASVAQVHRARLRHGAEVAVKVLRPNVRAQVERDSGLLLTFAKLLDLHPVLRLSDPVGFTREFTVGLVRQTDLRLEAENYVQFRENFKAKPAISFPRVERELSGERVLVMEFVRGQKVDQLGPGDHTLTARTLRDATMQMLFTDGFLHADMHPGNMVVREDGVIVLFDVGLATKLSPEILDMFVDLMKCIVMGTPDDTIEHLRRYHVYMADVDWDAVRRELDEFGKRWRGRAVAELDYGAMTTDILALGRRHHIRPVPELSLVIVGIVTIQGIAKMLAPRENDFEAMGRYLVPVLMRKGQALPNTAEAQRAQQALAQESV